MLMVRSVPLLGLVCFHLWGAPSSTAQVQRGTARELGLGRATVALEAEVFASANPAGLAAGPGLTAAFAVSRPFGLTELDLLSAGLATRLRSSRGSVAIERFGFSLLRSDRIVLTHARSVGPAGDRSATIGVRMTTERVAIAGQAATLAGSLGAGWLLAFPAGIRLGGSIDHLLRRQGTAHPPLERLVTAGISHRVSRALVLAAQVEKAPLHAAAFRSGLEWKLAEGLCLRLGLGTAPALVSFGLGVNKGAIRADVASTRHPWLGWTPALSATIDRAR